MAAARRLVVVQFVLVRCFSLRPSRVLSRLLKNSILRAILGGAALQRCDNCIVLNAALAAEGAALAQKRLLPQPVTECLIKPVGSPGHPCGSRFSMLRNQSFLSVLCVKDFLAAKQETVAILKLHHDPQAGRRAEVSKPATGEPRAPGRKLWEEKTPPVAEKTEPACRATLAGQWGHRDRRMLLR